jgi:hypothetical protein
MVVVCTSIPPGARLGQSARAGVSHKALIAPWAVLEPATVGEGAGEAVGAVVHYLRAESAARSAIACSGRDLESGSHSRQSATNAS